jgi:hypothetical protein
MFLTRAVLETAGGWYAGFLWQSLCLAGRWPSAISMSSEPLGSVAILAAHGLLADFQNVALSWKIAQISALKLQATQPKEMQWMKLSFEKRLLSFSLA